MIPRYLPFHCPSCGKWHLSNVPCGTTPDVVVDLAAYRERVA